MPPLCAERVFVTHRKGSDYIKLTELDHNLGMKGGCSACDMLRQRLCALQKTVARLACPRSSRQVLHRLPRRNSPAVCSQRRDFAAATRPLLAASRVYSQAVTSETHEPTTRDSNGASHPAVVGARKLTFQEAITALEQYWAKQSGADCAILLPHNTEVQHASSDQCRYWCKCVALLIATWSCPSSVDKASAGLLFDLHLPVCSVCKILRTKSHVAGRCWYNESSHIPQSDWT